MQTADVTLMTTSNLTNLSISISNAMERAAKVGNLEAMQSLLRDRRRVRDELDSRKADPSRN